MTAHHHLFVPSPKISTSAGNAFCIRKPIFSPPAGLARNNRVGIVFNGASLIAVAKLYLLTKIRQITKWIASKSTEMTMNTFAILLHALPSFRNYIDCSEFFIWNFSLHAIVVCGRTIHSSNINNNNNMKITLWARHRMEKENHNWTLFVSINQTKWGNKIKLFPLKFQAVSTQNTCLHAMPHYSLHSPDAHNAANWNGKYALSLIIIFRHIQLFRSVNESQTRIK